MGKYYKNYLYYSSSRTSWADLLKSGKVYVKAGQLDNY